MCSVLCVQGDCNNSVCSCFCLNSDIRLWVKRLGLKTGCFSPREELYWSLTIGPPPHFKLTIEVLKEINLHD
jgi:hypothetical protein